MSPAVSQFIDAARWLAALTVALHHTHNLFINQADIMKAEHWPPVYVWWFVTAYTFAHGAVVVFFVLSGFLVGGATVSRAKSGRPYIRKFLIDRTTRIYIVLLPALALTFVLDNLGQRVFAGLGVYEVPVIQAAMKNEYLLATLAGLQGIWFSTYGSNTALWSLGMEYWYYVICCFVLLPWSAAYGGRARGAGFALAAALFLALAVSPSYFLFGAALWWLGALARIAPRPLMRSRWLALMLWVAAMTAIRLISHGAIIEDHPRKEAIDAVNALLFANILLTLRFDGDGFSWCRARFHAKLSQFSYSLYSMHWPVLMWLQGAALVVFGAGWTSRNATPLHYGVAISALAAVIAAAWLFARMTEARTDDMRGWFSRMAPGGDPAQGQKAGG
ncbi:MAG: acyltransferase family protein [Rhodoblastus sp.]